MIRQPLVADTGEGIRFLGYDVVKERYANTQLILYFTATRQLAADYFVGLRLLSERGETLGETAFQQPTLVWYPTGRWRQGEIVRVVANTLTWSAEPDRFGLGLVLAATKTASSSGDDPDQPEARLRWLPAASSTPQRLLEDQTVLWLGDFRSQP